MDQDYIRVILMPKELYEPLPRGYFCASPVEGELFVWGGCTNNFGDRKRELTSTINRYKPHQEVWDLLHTQGSSPPGLRNGACTSIGDCLYIYGGWDGESRYHSLHHFNVRTCTWTQLSTQTTHDGPRMKCGCRMVSHGNKLVLFGGCYYKVSGLTQLGATYDDGDTNELHTFDLKEGKWFSPTITGTRPPPCSSFSFTRTDDHHAVLFGGYHSGSGRTNDVYILNLQRMHWSKLHHHKGESWPVGREGHAATCLGYGEADDCRLLVTGGWDGTRTLSDMWMLDLQSGKWKEITSSEMDKKPRRGHCAVAFNLSPNLTEVVIYGGDTSSYVFKEVFIADTYLLRFEKRTSTREWVLTDVANSQRGTRQRVREKRERIEQTSHSSAATPKAATLHGPPGGGVKVIEELEERVQEAERRAKEAESRLQEAERRSRKETSQWERRLQTSEERTREVERRLQTSEERVREAGRIGEERSEELERRLHLLETQWVVERREIQLTGPELGRGGWATVSVAMFRGIRVAAKSIHRQIISQHNIRVFQREMNMAARIRHPNLVQFIGATQEGEMIILTELMPTSLRKELEREHLPPSLAKSIGLDVTRALNYLHLMQPDPIIHRDISSANILLEPLPQQLGHWRAKVTDYGSVNLLRKIQTIGPGSPTYAAPEAITPRLQSPKMDIFSFGILLMEMLSGELPPSDERHRVMGYIRHPQLLSLIRRCLNERPEERPNASDIITELQD